MVCLVLVEHFSYMKKILLQVNDDILDNVIWLLKSLSISEVKLIDDFDYLEEDKLKEINTDLVEYKKGNKSNFMSLENAKRECFN